MIKRYFVCIAALAIVAGCGQQDDGPAVEAGPEESAEDFIARINDEYREWWREYNAADWLAATYINEDSAIVAAKANERYAAWHSSRVQQALKYDEADVSAETRRALETLKMSALMVARAGEDAQARIEAFHAERRTAGVYEENARLGAFG